MRVLVVGMDGRPVPGASAFCSSSWSGVVDTSRALGVAGADGWIEWPKSSIASCQCIAITAIGYASSAADPAATTQTVVLDPGHEWAVNCMDEDGDYVEGATLAAAMTSVDGGTILAELMGVMSSGVTKPPSPRSDIAIVTARTGPDGRAILSGLHPGRYFIQATHPCMIHVTKSTERPSVTPDTIGFAVPGPPAVVTMAKVYGVALAFPDDHLVGMAVRRPRDRINAGVNAGAGRSLAARAFLAKAGVDWGTVAVLTHEYRRATATPSLSGEFLFAHRGWIHVELPFTPVCEDPRPVVLPARPSTSVCREYTWSTEPPWVAPAGFPNPLIFLRGRSEGHFLRVPARAGEPFWMPDGEYAIDASSEFLGSVVDLPKDIRLSAETGASITFRRNGSLAPCELRFSIPGEVGNRILYNVRIAHENDASLTWSGWHPDSAHVPEFSLFQWVMPGVVDLSAVSPVVGPASRRFHIPQSGGVQLLELTWR
jgi:hypothetical protein